MGRGTRPGPVHLDTHVAIWLAAGMAKRIPPAASAKIEEGRLFISPMVELELSLLRERGRLRVEASTILSALATDIGLQMSEISFRDTIAHARTLNWARDPFDRVIVGESLAAGATILTKDRSILENCPSAVW